jgi:hypothetical protein
VLACGRNLATVAVHKFSHFDFFIKRFLNAFLMSSEKVMLR